MILCANPLAYGIYASAARIRALILQWEIASRSAFHYSLEVPMLGYMACRQELVRQLPGTDC